MKSFSDVSVIRVAGGYLLMVGVATAALSTHCSSAPKNSKHVLFTASFSWPMPASPCYGGTVLSPRGPWGWRGCCWWLYQWLPAWACAPCLASPSTLPPLRYDLTSLIVSFKSFERPCFKREAPPLFSHIRCCPSWPWASVWTTCFCWLTPSPKLELTSPSRYR